MNIYKLNKLFIVAKKEGRSIIYDKDLNVLFPLERMWIKIYRIGEKPIIEITFEKRTVFLNESLETLFCSEDITFHTFCFRPIPSKNYRIKEYQSESQQDLYEDDYRDIQTYIIVEKDDRYGLMNSDFELVLPIEYGEITYQANDEFYVRKLTQIYSYANGTLTLVRKYKLSYELDNGYNNKESLMKDILRESIMD